MVEIGRTYRHPRNGAEITILRDDAEAYVIEFSLPPGTGRARGHVHLDFEQDFVVLEGVADLSVDGVKRKVPAGETVHVPRGVGHVDPFNTGPDRLVFRNEIAPTPPFIPAYVSTVIARLADGRLRDGGDLPPLHLAVVIRETDGQSWATGPRAIQKVMLPVFAAVGRRRGYRIEQPG